MALLTESGLELETEDRLVLNRESFVKRLGRKKILFFPEIRHFEQVVKIRGSTKLPTRDEVITITANMAQQVSGSLQYKGTVRLLKESVKVVGTSKKILQEQKAKVRGTKSRTVNESIMIKGKKDYSVLINKIQKVLELEEPFGPYDDFDDCVRDQISKGKDSDAARSICGALQRDLKEDYDEYDWGDKVEEAKYQGRTVKLNKPFRTSGGPKKFAVYVMNKQGNVVIVRFGDPNMSIKRDDPERRKSFRARHNCSQKKDRTTPGYWSCKFWSSKRVGDLA
jgi:hypothetical protein